MPKISQRVMADAASESIKGLIKAFGPRMFVVGLNNACVHGEVFKDFAFDVDDAALSQWYDGIDTLTKAAEKLEDK